MSKDTKLLKQSVWVAPGLWCEEASSCLKIKLRSLGHTQKDFGHCEGQGCMAQGYWTATMVQSLLGQGC